MQEKKFHCFSHVPYHHKARKQLRLLRRKKVNHSYFVHLTLPNLARYSSWGLLSARTGWKFLILSCDKCQRTDTSGAILLNTLKRTEKMEKMSVLGDGINRRISIQLNTHCLASRLCARTMVLPDRTGNALPRESYLHCFERTVSILRYIIESGCDRKFGNHSATQNWAQFGLVKLPLP